LASSPSGASFYRNDIFSHSTASSYIAVDAGDLGEFGRFSVEILAQVDRDVDMRRYDNDGPDGLPDSGDDDGFVDYVFINVSSVPRGFLRGGATGIGGLGEDYASRDIGHDGNPIFVRGSTGYGAIQLEGSFSETVGVMAHEFGHGLGLPDLYALVYTEPAEDSGGIGNWGLMGRGALGWNGGDGPNPLSPWSLEKLGWISVGNGRLIDADQDRTGLRLDPLRRGGKVLRVALGGGSEREYLLLEQRTRGGGYLRPSSAR
jgi:M6 family metalloprotease-like protein